MSWRLGTPCAEEGPNDELWFPRNEQAQQLAIAEARAVCGKCPAGSRSGSGACLTYALTLPSNEDHGIYDGTTREERQRMKRKQATA